LVIFLSKVPVRSFLFWFSPSKMSSFRHLRLLLWKNYLLQLRHPWVTIFEIGIPCLFVVMISMIRIAVEVTPYHNSTTYESFNILNVPNISTRSNTYKVIYTPKNSPYQDVMKSVVLRLKAINDTYDYEGIQLFSFQTSSIFKFNFLIYRLILIWRKFS